MRIDEYDKMPYVWETISTMIFQSTARFSEEKGSTIYTNSLKHHWYRFTWGFFTYYKENMLEKNMGSCFPYLSIRMLIETNS